MALALLFALAVTFLYKTVLGNLIMAGLDVFTYFYPYKAAVAQAIRSGSLPLWNPYLFMGAPLLANIQSAVLYPLNLPLWWLSAPKMVSTSILIHLFLAAAFSYGFARRVLRFGSWAALMSALVLAFSGFLGVQAGHVNQLCVLAWLPLLLWLFLLVFTTGRVVYAASASAVVAVQLLGGHIQSSYINLVALGCYSLYLALHGQGLADPGGTDLHRVARRFGRSLLLLTIVVALGAGLAAVQLVPTLELSGLSIRSSGLPYREAVSFSLDPRILHRSLLPSLSESPFSEYVAYLGILPLSLALLGAYRGRREPQTRFLVAVALMGLFLALGVYNPLYYLLYRLLPGIAVFRVPARWLYLYVLGMSFLAGRGVQELSLLSERPGPPPRRWLAAGLSLATLLVVLIALDPPAREIVVYWAVWAVLGGAVLWYGVRTQRGIPYLALISSLAVLELLLASRYQVYNRVTAPQAFSSMRSSIAHLLTDDSTFRILSYSDGAFDPGDLGAIQEMLGPQLSEDRVYDYLVATKQKEILTPNLPLSYQIQSIDGYDGGILPLSRYVEWQRLLLPEDSISRDGRLQGRIREMPDGRFLNMHNVRYILTDKTYDVWIDGAYYDLAHRAVLDGEGIDELVLEDLPPFPATAAGVVSHLSGGADLPQRAPVAEITFTDEEGQRTSFVLRAGEDTAEGEYSATSSVHQRARVVGNWRGNPAGNDYYTLLEWGKAAQLETIDIRWLGAQGQFRVRGMTLLDQRTGTHRTLIVSTEGRYRLVHSGDVKIYENLDVMPRAYVVHQAQFLRDDEEVVALLKSEAFDPASEVVISADGRPAESYGTGCVDHVETVTYSSGRIVLRVDAACPGYLVLTDAHYPGWVAHVDGQPQEIQRSNLYFRAVYVGAGQHLVEFAYDPVSIKVGACISLLTALLLVGALGWGKVPYWRGER